MCTRFIPEASVIVMETVSEICRELKDKLDYLKELGIDVIWLSPVYRSPNDDNGYDISDYEDIMEEFGTMADFDRLLKKAHEKALRL